MSLRKKFVISFASIAAVVALVIGWSAYSTTERAMRSAISLSLSSVVGTVAAGGTLGSIDPPAADPDDARHHDGQAVIVTAQAISTVGVVTHLAGAPVTLPVSQRALALAKNPQPGLQVVDQVSADDVSYLVLTQSLGGNRGAVQVGRDLNETERVLNHLAVVTLLVGLAVLAAAAGSGWLLARRLTRRLTVLTAKAEAVSWTGDPDADFAMPGRDEVGTLSSSLQAMVGELSASRQAQQRLVQNAGHELRTPLTSLRTNIHVLRRFDELSADSQQRLLEDVDGETRELTNLVNELVELAMDRRVSEPAQPVDLVAVSAQLAARYEHRSGRSVQVAPTEPVLVNGRINALSRAISNLLDNALKFDTGRGPIQLNVGTTGVEVCDRGPGLADGDANRIFDRFYRATGARSKPGSGLGLAIVAEVAAAHGGNGTAHPRAGGGACIGFTLGAETFLPDSKPGPTQLEDAAPSM